MIVQRVLAFVALGGVALAATFQAVDVTITTDQADGTLQASPTASPVLGIKNPPVKAGVAYVGLSRRQGEYSAVLSTKLPVALHCNLTQGTLNANLARVMLRDLDLKTNQTDVKLNLSAVNLQGTINATQGSVQLTVPAQVGVQLNLKKWNMGSVTFNGQEVASGLKASGSYATPNFETAKYKLRFDVVGDMTDLSVVQK